MPDTRHAIVTTEHIQRAYAQLHRPDWPGLDEMQRMATQMAIVRARACALAHGHALPTEPTARLAPATPPAANALGRTPHRRRTDGATDIKRLAAGDRDD